MIKSYILLLGAFLIGCTTPPEFDLLILNGRVIDGSGGPVHPMDIGIVGDRIIAMGKLSQKTALKTIDASNKVVAPGFIDAHTHAVRGIYKVPTAEPFLLQGVTTVVEGNDGSSPFPLGEHFQKITTTKISPNWASFVGQGTLRKAVMGLEKRAPTADELAKMQALTRRAMEEGALGLSTGLFYVPGNFSTQSEIETLATIVGQYGGIYISHMRDEAKAVLASVEETLSIGKAGNLPAQITHHKIIGKSNWGLSKQTLEMVDAFRAEGHSVYLDQYPYTASQTSINALIPQWAQAGGREALLKRLEDPKIRKQIKDEVIYRIQFDRGGGDPKNVFISECKWMRNYEGKNLAELTQERGKDPTPENAAETVFAIIKGGGARAVYHAISEQDIQNIMQHPLAMIASDGPLMEFNVGKPHPRSYGTFARVLGKYVREDAIIPLQEAIRKMTSLPAKALRIKERGLLVKGYFADVVIFDPETIIDHATFENPHQYATGVSHVIVNGEVVVKDGVHQGNTPGRVLFGQGYSKRGGEPKK